MSKAKFKFRHNRWEMICSKCSKFIKDENFFTDDEWLAVHGEIKLPAQYCDECLEKMEKDV